MVENYPNLCDSQSMSGNHQHQYGDISLLAVRALEDSMKTANLAAIAVFVILLASCSMFAPGTGDAAVRRTQVPSPAATRIPSADLPNAILGKWEKAGSPIVTIEFFKDGKVDVTNSMH